MNEWDSRYVAAGREWSVISVSLSCSSAPFSFPLSLLGSRSHIVYGYGNTANTDVNRHI